MRRQAAVVDRPRALAQQVQRGQAGSVGGQAGEYVDGVTEQGVAQAPAAGADLEGQVLASVGPQVPGPGQPRRRPEPVPGGDLLERACENSIFLVVRGHYDREPDRMTLACRCTGCARQGRSIVIVATHVPSSRPGPARPGPAYETCRAMCPGQIAV